MSGSIAIETSPSNAEIYLNSKKYGRTNKTIWNLAEGHYQIRLVLPGYNDIIVSRQVRDSKSESIRESFIPEHTPQPVSQVKQPSSLSTKVFYAVCVIGLLFFIMVIFSPPSSSELSSAATNPSTYPTTLSLAPTQNIVTKDLALRRYGDYLQPGQTNTYYFDITGTEPNLRVIKVVAQAKAGNKIQTAVGLNYIPFSQGKKYDYVSASSMDATVEIYNPKPGRYFVTVTGISGSGDTSVYRSIY